MKKFYFLFTFIILNISSFEQERKLFNFISEIDLVINGDGYQQLISKDFAGEPNEVYVNGIFINTCRKDCTLENDINYLILKFNSQLTTCEGMFKNLENIIEIDLSNFDFSKVKSMNKMFYNCKSLKKITFGNINTSSVNDMQAVFNGCKSLVSLDLSRFDTSNVNTMQSMFYQCSNLKYLNLTKFITAKTGNLISMFNGCSSLKYLNLKSCKFKNSINVDNIFMDIPSSVKCCIEDQTSKDKLPKNKVIFNCSDDCFKGNIKIDLENFSCIESCSNSQNKYEYNNYCYNECPKGTLINNELCEDNICNINNQNIFQCLNKTPEGYYFDSEDERYKKCFANCKFCYGPGNISNNNCIEFRPNLTSKTDIFYGSDYTEMCKYYYYVDEFNNSHCIENCTEKYNKLIPNKNRCIDECKKDDIYIYNYQDICYNNCPNGTILSENDYICLVNIIETNNINPKMNNSETEKEKIIEDILKHMNITTNEKNEIIKTTDLLIHSDKILNEMTNDLGITENYYNTINDEIETNSNFFKDETNNNKKTMDSEEQRSIIEEKISNDIKYITTNEEIEKNSNELTNGKVKNLYTDKIEELKSSTDINSEKLTDVLNTDIAIADIKTNTNIIKDGKIDDIIKIILSSNIDITKDERDEHIQNFREQIFQYNITKNKEDIIETKNGVFYQMTTSDNQKNNSNKNISTINLGDCEKILKKEYNIDENLPLIIFKIDFFSPDTLIPIIGYEIYHPINKSKLNLSYCEDILIKLNIPVSIDESKLFKYDPKNEFYTDNCFPYTTENGTDIILNDRKQEFINNNLSLCENNCNYTGYDQVNKRSACDCNIKNKMELISEIINNPNKLSNKFNTDDKDSNGDISNIITIKCTKTLFSKDGLKYNISSYILLLFLNFFIFSILLFIKCGYSFLITEIDKILNEKEKKTKNKRKIKKSAKKGESSNIMLKGKIHYNNEKINYPPKKYNINFINNINNNIINYDNPINENNDDILNENNKISRMKKKRKKRKIIKKKIVKVEDLKNFQKLSSKISYNDFELNNLDYENSIIYDKRTFCQYYFSLLKTKHILLFTFCLLNDYNSKIIKLCIFCLTFSVYYAINFAFFDDEMIHKIYEKGGKYDITFFLPKIFISFIISYFINIMIKYLFLSERNISNVKQQTNLYLADSVANKEKRNLFIKYIIFFILGILFLGFFWLLLSSFGAVYQNTQVFIFINAIISFSISLIYPFFINIFPCIFRISSLKSSDRNEKYKYYFSKFLQLI